MRTRREVRITSFYLQCGGRRYFACLCLHERLYSFCWACGACWCMDLFCRLLGANLSLGDFSPLQLALTASSLFLSLASRAAREMCFYTAGELRFGYETGSNYCQCQKEIYRPCPSSTYTTLFIAVLHGTNVSRDKTYPSIIWSSVHAFLYNCFLFSLTSSPHISSFSSPRRSFLIIFFYCNWKYMICLSH